MAPSLHRTMTPPSRPGDTTSRWLSAHRGHARGRQANAAEMAAGVRRTPMGRLQRDGIVYSSLRIRVHQIRRQHGSAIEMDDMDLYNLDPEERADKLAIYLTRPVPPILRDEMRRAMEDPPDAHWIRANTAPSA